MVVTKLECLVLRGVVVLRDGKAVGVRLGTSYLATTPTPEITISTRLLSHRCASAFMQAEQWPDHADPNRVADATGAGRPLSRAGVLSRRSPASFAGRVVRYGWPGAEGRTALAAARRRDIRPSQSAASENERFSRRLLAVEVQTGKGYGNNPIALRAGRPATATPAWRPSAGETLSASTWGKGA
jgi:hypothetical protein